MDEYLRYHNFDRVDNLRGRRRNAGVFATEPNAPQLIAPVNTQVAPQAPAPRPTMPVSTQLPPSTAPAQLQAAAVPASSAPVPAPT